MAAALVAEIEPALSVVYGAGVANATRKERREAERILLSLRRIDPPSTAMQACFSLLEHQDAAYATFAAQTITYFCRHRDTEPGWFPSLVAALRVAADAGRPHAVSTAIALGITALYCRRRACAAGELVGAIAHGLGLLGGAEASVARIQAALRVFVLLPEEQLSDHLALGSLAIEELREELSGFASAQLVQLCMPQLGATRKSSWLTATALECLSAWVQGGMLPWLTITPMMQPAMQATTAALASIVAGAEEEEFMPVARAGCGLLSAVAGLNDEEDVADQVLHAALTLGPGFTSACEQAAAQARLTVGGHVGDEPSPPTTMADVGGVLATLFADVGNAYHPILGKHTQLLDLLLAAARHPCTEVSLPSLGFWRRSGHAVLADFPSATQPLLAALVEAVQYPADMAMRDSASWELKDEQRAEARHVLRAALVGVSSSGGQGSAAGADACALTPLRGAAAESLVWLLEAAAAEAVRLASSPDPLLLPSGPLPPTTPPSADPLPWQPLEAQMHLLAVALASWTSPGAAACDGAKIPSGARALLSSSAAANLLSAISSLPARRALWREAAILCGEWAVAMHTKVDAVEPSGEASALESAFPEPLLMACCAAIGRTLGIDESGASSRIADPDDDDDDDEPFEFVTLADPASSGQLHAGASALWRMGSTAAVAVRLAAQPDGFDAVLRAWVQACSAIPSGGAEKARVLLEALC
jgi:hypothetical protein